jgi:DNA-directed RNA polymerase specialized sigma24 family protein
MTEHDIEQATAPESARRSRRRESQFQGMHVLETDEPLLATLWPNEQAVLRTNGSYGERAKELNVPVGTLKSRLHRARAKLVALRGRTQPEPH